jgi:hypothetical protein
MVAQTEVSMSLQRLVLDYRTGELVVRCLYKSRGESNPGTKRRLREVEDLCRQGLRDALRALEGDVEMVGTSGFTTREDVLCSSRGFAPSSLHKKTSEAERSTMKHKRVSRAAAKLGSG